MKKPIISYCIPVKNRSEDLRATLGENLAANSGHRGAIEFIVVCFDEDDELLESLSKDFPLEIKNGYLRTVKSGEIDRWHFGRAKNVFKPLIRGDLYSSLDADNYVSAEETQQILDLFAIHGPSMVLHHFSGEWGDGTCGRLTTGAEIYRTIGYDPLFMPRQYDEIDFILSALRTFPAAPYISYLAGGALEKSRLTSAFINKSGLVFENIVVPQPSRRPPLNPKAEDYSKHDTALNIMVRFNQGACYAKNSKSIQDKAKYASDVTTAGYDFVEVVDASMAFDTFLRPASGMPQPAAKSKVPVFACVKDDEWLLREWLDHYRSIGAGPFYIVDDGSKAPVHELLNDHDVHVFTPKVGSFRTSKGVWLKTLMKRFLAEGQWALTVDADEFVDVGTRNAMIADICGQFEDSPLGVVPGVLLDMLPSSRPWHSLSGREVLDVFDSHFCGASIDAPEYGSHPAIKWAWGEEWSKSHRIDARYHLFGTIDVLRKVPLIRYRGDLRLNQGFHDASSGQTRLPATLWNDRVLAIRHYKLAKLFSLDEKARLSDHANGEFVYHERTTDNLRRLADADACVLFDKIQEMPTATYNPENFQRAFGGFETPAADGPRIPGLLLLKNLFARRHSLIGR